MAPAGIRNRTNGRIYDGVLNEKNPDPFWSAQYACDGFDKGGEDGVNNAYISWVYGEPGLEEGAYYIWTFGALPADVELFLSYGAPFWENRLPPIEVGTTVACQLYGGMVAGEVTPPVAVLCRGAGKCMLTLDKVRAQQTHFFPIPENRELPAWVLLQEIDKEEEYSFVAYLESGSDRDDAAPLVYLADESYNGKYSTSSFLLHLQKCPAKSDILDSLTNGRLTVVFGDIWFYDTYCHHPLPP